jgi:Domain of unknown function (DUF397)
MRPSGAPQTTPLVWRRSSFCASGECVEVAELNGMIAMRDAGGHTLYYTAEEFRYLIRSIKDGRYDFGR